MYLGISYNLQNNVMPITTFNPHDFTVIGNGFFVVFDESNKKNFLTKNGKFMFNNMNILVNEDGYFVIGHDGEYIHSNNINAEKRNYFPNTFLVVLPIEETINYYTSKYIDASEFIVAENNDVYNRMLRPMPIFLDILLDKALLDLENNREYANIQEIINLFYIRYHEIVKLSASSDKNNMFLDEYFNSLLIKIEYFLESVRNPRHFF
jgi:flagellar hook protein FlgE